MASFSVCVSTGTWITFVAELLLLGNLRLCNNNNNGQASAQGGRRVTLALKWLQVYELQLTHEIGYTYCLNCFILIGNKCVWQAMQDLQTIKSKTKNETRKNININWNGNIPNINNNNLTNQKSHWIILTINNCFICVIL